MKKNLGFTLIELLSVILITCLLSFMAAGMWSSLQLRMEARAAMTMVASSLSNARNTAISRQIPVAVCGSRNASKCDSLWQDGVLVFLDVAGLGKPSSDKDILGFYRIETRNAHIQWKGFGSTSSLRFDRLGRASASNGSFTYCPGSKDNNYARQVVINRGGRVRYSKDRNGDGIHEDASGKPLSCP